jgi:hypothetical protein
MRHHSGPPVNGRRMGVPMASGEVAPLQGTIPLPPGAGEGGDGGDMHVTPEADRPGVQRQALFSAPPQVVNIGLEGFARDLAHVLPARP